MSKRDRVFLLVGALTGALTLLGPRAADANSRRHIDKPDLTVADITRESAPTRGAPEVDGSTLGLGLALVAGGVAALAGRRRAART
jgi:hypothetical protein